MSMKKNIMIDGQEVAFKASAAMSASLTIRPVATIVTSAPSVSTAPLPISNS